MILSFILPHYKRFTAFAEAYEHNAPAFSKPEAECVIAADDPTEREELLGFVSSHPETKWRLLMNEAEHPWRPPCRAINVAIRHALASYVCILSPETHIDLPYPEFLMNYTTMMRGITVQGSSWLSGPMHFGRNRDEPWRQNWPEGFGMLMTLRSNLEELHGYDESWSAYGGEDDNIRARLARHGVSQIISPQIRLSHYESFDSISNGGHVPRTKEHFRGGGEVVTNESEWGQEEGWTKIFDWRQE